MMTQTSILYGVYHPERDKWLAFRREGRDRWSDRGISNEYFEVDSPWHHYAVRMEKDDMVAKFYRDGLHYKGYQYRELQR